jgi:thiamine biosynthesis lipoprotein
MNRRDFLHPRQLARTAGQLFAALDQPDAPPALLLPQEVALLRLGRRAMATSFEIVLPFTTPHAVEAGEAAFDLLDELEDQLTVYRDTSEVSRLNRLAPSGPVPVEERLFTLLQLAARITEETGGAYDVTAGALIKAWGFFSRQKPRRVPSDLEREEALSRVGMHWVALDPETREVRYLRDRLEVNLGSIGKGYALDRLAELLGEDANWPAFLLHGGCSSVYAKGSPTGDPRGWPVGVAHPWVRRRRLGVVWLRDRALGTSAATFQHLVHNGRKLGHVLDPRTGWPADEVASVTVVAATAAEADALSTAFFTLGLDGTRAYCAAHPEVGVIALPKAAPPVVLNLPPGTVVL